MKSSKSVKWRSQLNPPKIGGWIHDNSYCSVLRRAVKALRRDYTCKQNSGEMVSVDGAVKIYSKYRRIEKNIL